MKEDEENNTAEPIVNVGNQAILPIENLIYVIRGRQVMLDSDLARLYGVETKRLNEQVKRNIERFPADFMIQLTKEELNDLKSQIVTSSSRSQFATLNVGRGQNIKYLPFAFTENGVAMLSSVLRSNTAIEVNIRIMRAFTAMRSFLMNNANVFHRVSRIRHAGEGCACFALSLSFNGLCAVNTAQNVGTCLWHV